MNKITVADCLLKFLELYGVKDSFMLTGGAAMHLNDSFRKNKKIKKYILHHEQSCSMAADAYFRISNKPAAVCVTAGPGSINALNGVFGAFVDSIPMIVVSGQARTDNIAPLCAPGLRQFGDQEVDIVSMAKPITKLSVRLKKEDNFVKIFHKVLSLAEDGRPGPVWIDIPIDVQSMLIDKPKITDYKKPKIKHNYNEKIYLEKKINKVLALLSKAKRPVMIVGNGIRFSGKYNEFLKIIKKLSIPVLPVFNSTDLIPSDHDLYCGRPGADGDRSGNFVQQNSDLLIILGARMHIRQVGFNSKSFAREAKKIMIDVDKAEMNKPNLNIDLKIQADLKHFLPKMLSMTKDYKPKEDHKDYLMWSKKRKDLYPVLQSNHYKSQKNTINPYAMMEKLFSKFDDDEIIVTGDGTAVVVSYKTAVIKNRTRYFHNKGCASMGWDLPAAIGASIASKKNRTICITGDGSIMLNLQELQTIIHHKLPIKIFVINNDGYHSIRQSQANYYNGKEIGCGPSSGISFPNFKKVFESFGIKSYQINSLKNLEKNIDDVLKSPGPTLTEVIVDKNQLFEPRLASKKLKNGQIISPPLEDMAPFLDREEFLSNMIIKPWDDN
jgi:acetolactate synthase-1/2/3 large subunit